jgi:hypothetical protein
MLLVMTSSKDIAQWPSIRWTMRDSIETVFIFIKFTCTQLSTPACFCCNKGSNGM